MVSSGLSYNHYITRERSLQVDFVLSKKNKSTEADAPTSAAVILGWFVVGWLVFFPFEFIHFFSF